MKDKLDIKFCFKTINLTPRVTPRVCDPESMQKTCPEPAANHYPKELTEGNDDNPTTDEDPYAVTTKGTLGDFDAPGNEIKWAAGSVGDKVETRSQFVQFVRIQIGNKWYVISDFQQGEWKFHMKSKKVSEQTLGQDLNSDDDTNDELWIDDGSNAAKNNTGF